jgi:hypothetical protein
VSAWELSTQCDPKRKATSDIRTREKESPASITPANAAYVAVPAQRFGDEHRWVRVIDADDLSMSPGQCPAVARR